MKIFRSGLAAALILPAAFITTLVTMNSARATELSIKSADMPADTAAPPWMEYNGMGCAGENRSPELNWSGEPQSAQSFALSVFDPDAPHPNGWMHWLVVNIPVSVHELQSGAGNENSGLMPSGAQELTNSFGANAFGGACPPQGDKPHRYQFTIYAMPQARTEIPAGIIGKDAVEWLKSNSLGSSTLTVTYERQK